jgi:hypothetical protein
MGASVAGDEVESNRQQWEAMSREERAKIVEAYRKWKRLNENRRVTIRRRYQQFRSLPGEEKLNVAINIRRLRQMPPEKRQMLKRHLHIAPGRRIRQMAVMKVISLIKENKPAEPLDRKKIAQTFRRMECEALINDFYPNLPKEQKEQIDALTGKPRKCKELRRQAIEKIRRDLENNPPAALPPKDAPDYRSKLRKQTLLRYYGRVVRHMPFSMIEMALFIRAHARRSLPPQQTLELVEALKNGPPSEEVREKVQALLQTQEMQGLIASMPPKMRRRFESEQFGQAKRQRVVIMALRPLNELRPRARRLYLDRRGGRLRHIHRRAPHHH